MELTTRQAEILALVTRSAPITGEQIASELGLSRPTIRSDLAVLVMLGYLNAKPKVGYFPGNYGRNESAWNSPAAIKVKEVVARPVVVRDNASVNDAVVTLFVEDVGSLIVVDEEGCLMGVISRKDLLKLAFGNPNAGSMPVTLVMTRQPNIVTVDPEEAVVDAARKMIHHQVDGLPVVQKITAANGKTKLEVVGRITKTTMTKLLIGASTAQTTL